MQHQIVAYSRETALGSSEKFCYVNCNASENIMQSQQDPWQQCT